MAIIFKIESVNFKDRFDEIELRNQKTILKIADYPPGIYLFRFSSEFEIKSFKIIKL